MGLFKKGSLFKKKKKKEAGEPVTSNRNAMEDAYASIRAQQANDETDSNTPSSPSSTVDQQIPESINETPDQSFEPSPSQDESSKKEKKEKKKNLFKNEIKQYKEKIFVTEKPTVNKNHFKKNISDAVKEMHSRLQLVTVDELDETTSTVEGVLKADRLVIKPDDEMFEEAGFDIGVMQVWQIVRMVPIQLDSHKLGTFLEGDCYICMYSFEAQDEAERLRKIFLWMGKDASFTKRAICVFLCIYVLKQQMEGKLVVNIEEQGEESTEFIKLLNAKLNYVKGCETEATLNPVKNEKYRLQKERDHSRLVKIHLDGNYMGKRFILDKSIQNKPFEQFKSWFENTQKGSTIVVETPENDDFAVCVWIGKDSIQPQMLKAIDVATQIQETERHLVNKSVVIIKQDSTDEDDKEDHEKFWKLLYQVATLKQVDPYNISSDKKKTVYINSCDAKKAKGESDPIDDLDDKINVFKLVYENEQVNIEKVEERPLSKKTFKNEHVYLVETKHEMYVLYGIKSWELERNYAYSLAIHNIENNPDLVYLHAFFKGNEPVLFRERFLEGYSYIDTPETFEQRLKNLSNIDKRDLKGIEESEFDENAAVLDEDVVDNSIFDKEDDGSGTVQVFRVESATETTLLSEEDVGHFFTGDCYLILYEWNRNEHESMMQEAEEESVEEEGAYYEEDDYEEDEYKEDDDDYEIEDDDVKPYQDGSDSDEDETEKALRSMGFTQGRPEGGKYTADEIQDLQAKKLLEEMERERMQLEKEDEKTLKKMINPNTGSDDEVEVKPEIVKDMSVKKKKIKYLSRRILFAWEGSESKEKVFLKIQKKNFMGLATDPINPAMVVTQKQGKECDNFMKIFEHMMVIHRGKSTQHGLKDPRLQYNLFRIYCKSVINSKAIEIPKLKKSLNANDVLVLVGHQVAWVWCGRYANVSKRKIAMKFAQVLCIGKDSTAIEEGLEPEEFFEDLGDELGSYVQTNIKYAGGIVHECVISSDSVYRVCEIGKVGETFIDTDLRNAHNTLIFEFDNYCFIWYPNQESQVKGRTKTLANNAAKAIMEAEEEDSDEEEEEEEESEEEEPEEEAGEKQKPTEKKHVKKYKIEEVYKGSESNEFKQMFLEWIPNIYVDKFKQQEEDRNRLRREFISKCLPFLDEVRREHPYYITHNEYVNVENMYYLLKIAKKCGTNFELLTEYLSKLSINDYEFTPEFESDLMKFAIKELPDIPAILLQEDRDTYE